MFELTSTTVKLAARTLLSNIHYKFAENKITAILGANGAGKSTLLKCLLGEFQSKSNSVLFNHTSIDHYELSELSRKRAYIAQAKPSVFNMSVMDYWLLARSQYTESQRYSENLVFNAAKHFQLTSFITRDISTLSGGELQLVEFVRAYLQLYEGKDMAGKCLLLDEPASALDIKQTRVLYKHVLDFQKSNGTVIIIDHDINQVSAIAHEIVLIKKGQIMAHGPVEEVFNQNNLDACFSTEGSLLTSKNKQAKHYHLSFVD